MTTTPPISPLLTQDMREMQEFYTTTCMESSKLITNRYSTSFSMGIRMFDKSLRTPIYGIYGFVRLADEIVDTFHDFNQRILLDRLRKETNLAIDEGISFNPVLQAFQQVVNQYGIDRKHIDAFLDSMEMDLDPVDFDQATYERYIYGSAEVIGLMCLKVFLGGDQKRFDELEDSARALGSAFQKINFLRDMKSDFVDRGRVYFPGVDYNTFDDTQKQEIELDIAKDFAEGLEGIVRLPDGARLGVHTAYRYYTKLFDTIRHSNADQVLQRRIRVSDWKKMYLLAANSLRHSLNML